MRSTADNGAVAGRASGNRAGRVLGGYVRYFEDFHVGQRIAFGRYTVTQSEIIEFAKRYDPQVFHIDEAHAVTAELGGIMASGWHTTAIFMRLAVDAYLGDAAVLTSPGVDELRWLAPVRVGDIISGEAVVEQVEIIGIQARPGHSDYGCASLE